MGYHMSLIATAIAATPSNGATATQPGAGGGLSMILLLGAFFVIFYFLTIRPQSKKAKEHRNMLSNLAKGDEVITNGGLLGKINKITDNYLSIELAEGIEVKIQKQAISACLPKGTINSI